MSTCQFIYSDKRATLDSSSDIFRKDNRGSDVVRARNLNTDNSGVSVSLTTLIAMFRLLSTPVIMPEC